MLEKIEILIVIIGLLIAFYLVISFGATGKNRSFRSPQIRSYLFGVRALIIVIGIASLILWLFL